MPAPLYKRWAPPKIAPATSSLVVNPAENHATASKPSIAKEEARTEHTSHARPVTEDTQQNFTNGRSIPIEPSIHTSSSEKKRPKRKREPEAAGQHEEETPKKYKGIMSKFAKASRKAELERRRVEKLPPAEAEGEPTVELHDLRPMPQPAPVPEPVFEPTFSTLPTWLAKPTTIQSSETIPFAKLGVAPFYQERLANLGFKDALAVQTALLPMLHPGYQQHLGDICVSAKTGSGKTLAYLLPIIEALKDRAVPTLSAIIVVPTRQLVNQALQVAQDLCAGTKIQVGTALGNVPFATEQKQLVKTWAHYSPAEAQSLNERASQQLALEGIYEDLMSMPLDHVPQYTSGVDILICTPGRLVEHIEKTTGFLLNSVRWLVIDEADQLLNQNFQGWSSVLMDALHGETSIEFMNPLEHFLKREKDTGSPLSIALPTIGRLTKVILSATMEKDLTKLGTLQLRRPKLVVIQDVTVEERLLEHEDNVFEVPLTLDEFAVAVGDGSHKPLYLLHLLMSHVFQHNQSEVKKSTELDSDPDSVSDSDSSSDPSSDSSSDSESGSSSSSHGKRINPMVAHKNRVLIFTKSTENASRLSHLLSVLEPTFKGYIKTMTRALTAESSRRLLKSFNTGEIKILIASDAASRGLDVPSITHVVNYDMPTSITNYVHRVGRTARAGKSGQAWTLFTRSEAAWFLKQVAKGDTVRRGSKKVKRLDWRKDDVLANGREDAYRAALQHLEDAVKGTSDRPV